MRLDAGDDSGTPRQLHRVVAADPDTPPRSTARSHTRTVAPQLMVPQFQTSESAENLLPVSPEAGPRVYRIHPVRSETDFGRSAAVYSTEWHAPVHQYQGGPSQPQGGPSQFQGGPSTSTPGNSGGGSWTASSQEDPYDSRFNCSL